MDGEGGRERAFVRRPGLAARLALGTGLVFAAFAAAVLAVSLHQFRRANEEVVGAQQAVLAATVAGEIEVGLQRARAALEAAAARATPAVLADPRAAQAWLEQRPALQLLFADGIWLLDGAGRTMAARLPGGRALPPEEATLAAAGETFSRAHAALASGQPSIHVTVPVAGPGGAPAGRLVGAMEVPGEGFLPRLRQLRIGREGYFGLVTADRLVLVHRDPARVLRPAPPPGVNLAVDRGLGGYEGWLRAVNAAGVEMVAAVHRVPSTGWIVVANLPVAEADAPFLAARRWHLLATVAAALVLLGVVWVTARRLTRPLAALAREVDALAEGAGPLPAGPRPRATGEAATLAAAFDRLVAQRRRAEADLRVSEERFRGAFHGNPEAMALLRLRDRVVVEVNDGFTHLFGVEAGEVQGRPADSIDVAMDPADRAALAADAQAPRFGPRDVALRRRDGDPRVVSFTGARLDVGGEAHVLLAARDVTEERRASAHRARLEADLRASEGRHLSVVRNLPVVQWAIGEDGRFTLSVGGALPKLGLAEGEVVGRRVEEVYAAAPDVLRDYRRALAGESFVALNDFGAVVFESHWSPARDGEGRVVGVSGQAVDVTERVRAEQARRDGAERLAALERLAAMGRVAAGVAHEINNPLTYVIGALDAAAERLRGGGPGGLATLVAEARGGAERVRRIVGDLRVFSRSREEPGGACDAAAVARAAVAMVQNEVRHRARLELELGEAPPAAMSGHRLEQVLVNLLLNACHAIPEGRAGENRIGLRVRPDGGGVLVEVQDSGVGMTAEVRARIFEPFFTTRQAGEGTGLGLALCQAMVAEVGGRIEVETAPGQGSTFRVRLPAAAAPAEAPVVPVAPAPPAAPAAAAAAEPLGILVVDDEPMVGRAVARLLSGHRVDLATSGAEALARIRRGAAYQVVVCDLMMPDMTGMDLRERLAEEAPALVGRMVFLTGGAFTERARAFVAQGGLRVLEKPVDLAALRAAVAEAAGAGARAG